MKTEETILGEFKIFEVDHDFTFRGEEFKKGERLEVTAEDARELLGVRTLATFDDSRLSVQAGRMTGGCFTLERCKDGAHRVSFWNRSYLESDPWVRVRFEEDAHGLAKKGDIRRLRLSDAREREHRYQDSGPRLPGQPPARITILEPRPRPNMSPEEVRERQAAVAAGLAKERDGWVSSAFKRI